MQRGAILSLTLLLMTWSIASGDDSSPQPPVTPYIGVSVGGSAFGGHIDAKDDGSLSDVEDDGTSWVRSLYVGCRGSYAGLEVGYIKLGESEFTGTSSGGPSWLPGTVAASIQAKGWQWSAIVRYPINDVWAASGRVGGFTWEASEDLTGTTGSSSREDHGTTATFGLGIEHDPHWRHIVLRAAWDHFMVGADDLSVDAFTAGLGYRFF